jgi:NTE family protein
LVLLFSFQSARSEKIVIGGLDGLPLDDEAQKYSILLALSGGGARGLSTIGILKAFEEKNISVKGIAGTSIGGIIGGLYAAGYSPKQLDSISSFINFEFLFKNSPPRRSMYLTNRQEKDRHLFSIRFNKFRPVIPKALTSGQELNAMLAELTTPANYQCGSNFNNLKIPFKTICTDIVSGDQVILESGSIADAMRATMAFPLAFTGLDRGERILMDGGMVTPVPVDIARTLSDSINFVVAVNTSSILVEKDELNTPIDIANQVTSIMTSDKLKNQLAKADYVISPPIDSYNSTDFKFLDSLTDIGYKVGLKAADEIIDIIKNKEKTKNYFISSMEIKGYSDSVASITELLNKSFNTKQLNDALRKIFKDHNLFRLEANFKQSESKDVNNGYHLELIGIPKYRFSEISCYIEGNSIFSDELIASKFITKDSLMTPACIKDGIDKIIDLYLDKGYDLVFVRDTTFDFNTKTISLTIDEGIVRQIDIKDNNRTKDWYVRSYFPLKKGQPYSTKLADEGISNIYGTDLFDQVTINTSEYDNGVKVNIVVEEKNSQQIRVGWHWDDEYESEEFIEFLDDNFAGIGLEYLLHARYANRRQHYHFAFKADRILSTNLTARFLFFHDRLEREIYSADNDPLGYRYEEKTGVHYTVGQQIARLGTVTTSLLLEEAKYDDPSKDLNESFGLRSLRIESLVENFDRVPFPVSGMKNRFQLQFTGKIFGGEIEFTRFLTSHEAYIPLNKYINYHPYLAIGASRSGLPPTEQFYLGGLHSFIGYNTYQLVGDKMFLFSHELRFKLPVKFYFKFRYDMGEVYNHTDQIKLRNLKYGFGGALILDSPLGPVEFGYGESDTNSENYYLNIGLSF